MTGQNVAGAGTRLADRYQLTAPIASGGMAQVWRAVDTVLDRQVAVKILHPHLATDRGFLLRFRREAVAAARLSHPNIVGIYDTVSDDSVEAIVMELVEGRTLRDLLDEVGTVPAADAVELGAQISNALDEAHRAGVVHRDIKPSNVLVCADRRVMVTDFGIAKAGEDTDLTVTGTLLGTAKYLSPEQVAGDPVDPRSDLYALGVVLFEAITGRPPFRADTDAATALARLHSDPPRIEQYKPDLPPELGNIIAQLMSRDPGARYQRARDVRAALSAIDLAAGATDQTLVVAEQDTLTNHWEEEWEAEPSDGFLRSERSWIMPTLAVALVAGAVLVAGFLFARSPLGSESSTTEPTVAGSSQVETTVLTDITEVVDPILAGAQALDFESLGGDGAENDDLVSLAIDGDDETFWRTETYRSPSFGRLKPGIGFLIDLGGHANVRHVELETFTRDWALEVYVGDEFGDQREQWGAPAVTIDGDRNEDVDLDATGRFLLLWITDPGLSENRGVGDDDDDDDDDGPALDHRFELAEVSVS